MKIQIEIPEEFKIRMNVYMNPLDTKDYFIQLKSLRLLNNDLNLHLRFEPDNTHDPNAIRVFAHDIPIGYVLREDALSYNSYFHIINYLMEIGRLSYRTYFVNVDDQKSLKLTNSHRVYYELIVKVNKK